MKHKCINRFTISAIVFVFFFSTCFSSATIAQSTNLYNYDDLSHVFYAKQKDSLKKNWVCPALYKNKETQTKYKEFWDSRIEFITNALSEKNFIHETEIYNYVDKIITEIVSANSQYISKKPILLIDRSSSVNAYAIGGNIIAVNLGLLTFAHYREDIAMVVAHELSHNILNHTDNALKEKAEWLTSDEYKKKLNSILDSKYARLSRLNKVFENFSFDHSKHQRYKEGDADSLSIILIKNTKIPFDAAFLLRLDSSDLQYKQPLQKPIKSYIGSYNLAYEDSWVSKKSKGLSTRAYNFKDTTSLEDSLKTHPECKDRYAKCVTSNSEKLKHTPIPLTIQEKANKMIIWNLFNNKALTACFYRILLEKERGNTDVWYDFMVHNVFSGLFYADKNLDRFNAINVTQKEYISKDYYELQNMFEQIPRESLEGYCKKMSENNLWQKMPADAKALKSLFYSLNFSEETSDRAADRFAKEFINTNTNSMYCEFADHFRKK